LRTAESKDLRLHLFSVAMKFRDTTQGAYCKDLALHQGTAFSLPSEQLKPRLVAFPHHVH
jgi:hypothetical protein